MICYGQTLLVTVLIPQLFLLYGYKISLGKPFIDQKIDKMEQGISYLWKVGFHSVVVFMFQFLIY